MTAIIHLKSKVKQADAKREYLGKMLDENSYDALLTGGGRVYKPNGDLLCVLIKKAVKEEIWRAAFPALHWMKRMTTDNRGAYSASPTLTPTLKDGTQGKQTRADKVSSIVVGYYDRSPRFPYCRQTAFTANEVEKWETLVPLCQEAGRAMQREAPKRWEAQMAAVAKTHPAFVIPGSPYTTMTVNNTVRAGCHYDAGDLKAGIGCIMAMRKGCWTGNYLVFPEYRVAADLEDGDLLLFDAHEMHGNTKMIALHEDACTCDHEHEEVKNERVSVVFYFREKMQECFSPEKEAKLAAKQRGDLSDD